MSDSAPGSPTFLGCKAVAYRNGEDILRIVGAIAGQGAFIGGDLTLGSWRSHWLAREFAQQLGAAVAGDLQEVIRRWVIAGDADARVAGYIDRETAGDITVLTAHASATCIAAAMIRISVPLVLVLGPSSDREWMPEDVWLIRFLSRFLNGTGTTLLVAISSAEKRCLPFAMPVVELPISETGTGREAVQTEAWPDLPGLVPQAVDGATYPCIPTNYGWSLLLPEARTDVRIRPRRPNAGVPGQPLWFAAYRQVQEPPETRDPQMLSAAAADTFAEGGYNQAMRLLNAALPAARTAEERANLQTQAQAIRIAMLDFRAAAEVQEPDPGLPQSLIRELTLTKAWGLVMTGRADAADALFDRARALSTSRGRDPFWLYLLNISALGKFRTGQIDEAFKLEKVIESELSAFAPPHWHLKYINFINIARLHRHVRDYESARQYFDWAFEINLGLRSESDQIYLNLCQASLEQSQGNWAEALICLFRASLHWLSMPVPDALAPRVARAMEAHVGDRSVAASDYLYDQLSRLLVQIGPPFAGMVDEEAPGPRAWVRASTEPEGIDGVVVGAVGWAVLVRPVRPSDTQIQSAQQKLADLVFRLVRTLSRCSAVTHNACIVVDGCFGTDVPATEPQAIGLALRHNSAKIWFSGKNLILSDADARCKTALIQVALGPGVAAIGRNGADVIVAFRRSKRSLILRDLDARLAERAPPPRSLAELAVAVGQSVENVVPVLRRLEADGVVSLQLHDAQSLAS